MYLGMKTKICTNNNPDTMTLLWEGNALTPSYTVISELKFLIKITIKANAITQKRTKSGFKLQNINSI